MSDESKHSGCGHNHGLGIESQLDEIERDLEDRIKFLQDKLKQGCKTEEEYEKACIDLHLAITEKVDTDEPRPKAEKVESPDLIYRQIADLIGWDDLSHDIIHDEWRSNGLPLSKMNAHRCIRAKANSILRQRGYSIIQSGNPGDDTLWIIRHLTVMEKSPTTYYPLALLSEIKVVMAQQDSKDEEAE